MRMILVINKLLPNHNIFTVQLFLLFLLLLYDLNRYYLTCIIVIIIVVVVIFYFSLTVNKTSMLCRDDIGDLPGSPEHL